MPLLSVFTNEIILADAEIKNLPNVYKELIPAPGVGKAIRFKNAVLRWYLPDGLYTNVHADAALLITFEDWGIELSNIAGMPFGVAVNQVAFFEPMVLPVGGSGPWNTYSTGLMFDGMNCDNKPVKLVAHNDANGAFTAGGANNYLKISIDYSIIDL